LILNENPHFARSSVDKFFVDYSNVIAGVCHIKTGRWCGKGLGRKIPRHFGEQEKEV
jgi:hypothetical protein